VENGLFLSKIRVGEQSEACVISLLPTGQRLQSRTTSNYAMDGILELADGSVRETDLPKAKPAALLSWA
jgi:hypothetical protein